MALSLNWSDILAYNATLFKNIEQCQISWSSSKDLADWHSHALDGLKANSVCSMVSNQPPSKKVKIDTVNNSNSDQVVHKSTRSKVSQGNVIKPTTTAPCLVTSP